MVQQDLAYNFKDTLHNNKEKAINFFLSYCTISKYPAKSNIIHAGDIADSLYYIIEGSVVVLTKDEEGKEIILSYLNKGDFFGEMGFFDKIDERTAWIKTRTISNIARISYKKFYQLVQINPDILMILGNQIARRLQITTKQVSDLAFLDVTGRVAQTLLKLSKMPDAMTHPNGMQIKVTRRELGLMVGCSRETAGRVLKILEIQGLISAAGKTIVIHNTR